METKPKGALALSYTRDDFAPRIVARAERLQALRLLDIARDAGVPIVEDPDLWTLLEQADIGSYVPADCWQAVAAILAFVRNCDKSV